MPKRSVEKGVQGALSIGAYGAVQGNKFRKKYGPKANVIGAGVGAAAGFASGYLSGEPDPRMAEGIYDDVIRDARMNTLTNAQKTADVVGANAANAFARRNLNSSELAAGVESVNRGKVISNAMQSLVPFEQNLRLRSAEDRLMAERVGEFEKREGWQDAVLAVGEAGKQISDNILADQKLLTDEAKAKLDEVMSKVLPSNFNSWSATEQAGYLQQKGIPVPEGWVAMTLEDRMNYLSRVLQMSIMGPGSAQEGQRMRGNPNWVFSPESQPTESGGAPQSPTQRPVQTSTPSQVSAGMPNQPAITPPPGESKPPTAQGSAGVTQKWANLKNDPEGKFLTENNYFAMAVDPRTGKRVPLTRAGHFAMADPRWSRESDNPLLGPNRDKYIEKNPIYSMEEYAAITHAPPGLRPEDIYPGSPVLKQIYQGLSDEQIMMWNNPGGWNGTPSDPTKLLEPTSDVKMPPTAVPPPWEFVPGEKLPPTALPKPWEILPPQESAPGSAGGTMQWQEEKAARTGMRMPPVVSEDTRIPTPGSAGGTMQWQEEKAARTGMRMPPVVSEDTRIPTPGSAGGTMQWQKEKALRMGVDLLKTHEGFRPTPYFDTKGKLTVGYGRNLTDNPLTAAERKMLGLGPTEMVQSITRAQAEYLFENDLRTATHAARSLLGETFNALDPVRRSVVVNMAYNMGKAGLSGFEDMIGHLKSGNYQGAAEEMMNSQWFRENQTGRRDDQLVEMMRTGRMPGSVNTIPTPLHDALPQEVKDEIAETAKTPPTSQEMQEFARDMPQSHAAITSPSSPFLKEISDPHSFQVLMQTAALMGDAEFSRIIASMQQLGA